MQCIYVVDHDITCNHLIKYTTQQMNEICQISGTNKEMTYPFRFGTTNKLLHLTQHQLDRIPYLSNLITHKDDFSSIQTENGEYVLSSRIRFNWFSVILRSITTEHPSVLFTELSQEANVLSMLKLYDYLCINPLAVPVLKDKHLVQSNSFNNGNESKQVQYHRATPLEARDTAVLFIIALSRNEYNFDDFLTLQRIFNLIMIILSHPTIFSPRLCHHTLVIVKKYCFTLFSRKQQCQLFNIQKYSQNNTSDFSTSLCDDNQSLPENFQNSFAWKAVSVGEQPRPWFRRYSEESSLWPFYLYTIPSIHSWSNWFLYSPAQLERERDLWFSLRSSISESNLYQLLPILRARARLMFWHPEDKELYIYQIKQEQKKNEAESARSGYFNTVPRKPNVDKFKHRYGSKAQKYR